MSNWFQRNTALILFAGLVFLYIISVLTNLGCINLRVEEPRRMITALEMLETGNYVEPHTLGWAYYNKPPVFNWVLAGIIRLTGSDAEWAARMPSVICCLLLGISQYYFSKNYIGQRTALLASFFTLTSANLYFYGIPYGAEIDIFYSLVVYLQVICIFWFYEQKKYLLLFIVSWALCAAGFLTKGFPSLLFQGLTLAALCVYARSARIIFRWQHIAGILVFLCLTGAYFWQYNRYGSASALLINLLNESILKSTADPKSYEELSRLFTYPILLFRVLAPWCLLLLLLWKKELRQNSWNNPLVKFSLLFILFNIAVYWITSHQKARYIIMFIPFAMTIIARIYTQWENKNAAGADRYLKYTGIFFGLVAAGSLALPFFTGVAGWKYFMAAATMLVFMIFFYRYQRYRIWLLITGIMLIRFFYALIGLPLIKESTFDFEKSMKAMMANKTTKEQVVFYGKAGTLKLDVEIAGRKLFAWKGKPVQVLPPSVSYAVPYYFYRVTGNLLHFDTLIQTGRFHITYRPFLEEREKIDPVDSFYDKRYKDYLILFKKKE